MEDALTQVAREEQALGAAFSQRRQEAQLGHADVLGLVDDREVVGRIRGLRKRLGKTPKDSRHRDESALLEPC